MSMRRRLSVFLRRTACAFVAAGCVGVAVEACGMSGEPSAAPDAATGPSSNGVVLNPNVLVLTDEDAKDIQVEPDRLIVAADAKWAKGLKPGTILASGYGDGFLRRVRSSSKITVQSAGVRPRGIVGAALEILTEIVALDEAILSGTFDTGLLATGPLSLDLQPHLGAPFTAATASLVPTGRVTGEFVDASLRRFELRVSSKNAVAAAATLKASENRSIAEKQDIYTSPAYRWAFFIGPLPVVLVGHLKVGLGGKAEVDSAASLQLRASCTQQFDATVLYDGSSWSAPVTAPWVCDVAKPIASTDARATLDVYDRFRFDLKLYGVAGPSVETRAGIVETAHASVKSEDKLCPLKVDWSIDGYLGATFEVDVRSLAKKAQPWGRWSPPEVKVPISSGEWPEASKCSSDAGPDAADASPDAADASDAGSDAADGAQCQYYGPGGSLPMPPPSSSVECSYDRECGDRLSGFICLGLTLRCHPGCRGALDVPTVNTCPSGQRCTSCDLKPGLCVAL